MQKRTTLYNALCFWDRIDFEYDHSIFPNERYKHSAIYVEEQQSIYTFGGCDGNKTMMNDVWRFDMKTYQWQCIEVYGDIPSRRCDYSAILVSEQHGKEHHAKMIIFGGFTGQHELNDMYSLDLYTYHFTRIEYIMEEGHFITPRYGHTAVNVDNQYMYIFGGNDGRPSNEMWKLDLMTNIMYAEYVPKPYGHEKPLDEEAYEPPARYWHSMVYYPRDQSIYIFGGSYGSIMTQLGDLLVYHVKRRVWDEVLDENLGYWPGKRLMHSMVLVNDRMYLFGGFSGTMGHLATLHEFDMLTHYWMLIQNRPMKNIVNYEDMISVDDLPEARNGHSCCVVGEDEFVIFGGKNFETFDDVFLCRLPPGAKVRRSSSLLLHLLSTPQFEDVVIIL
jgi:hypothetical protein